MEYCKELKVSVLNAIQWLKIAWNRVSSVTIQHCFQHCSFTSEVPLYVDTAPPPSSELESLFDELKSHDFNIEGSVDDYTSIDNDVAIDGILSDNEIVSTVQGEEVLEVSYVEYDDDEPVTCPTISEYRNALDIVRRFVTCHSTTSYLNTIAELEDLLVNTTPRVKQTSLTDYL